MELSHNAQRGQDWRLRSVVLCFSFLFLPSNRQVSAQAAGFAVLRVLSRSKLDSSSAAFTAQFHCTFIRAEHMIES